MLRLYGTGMMALVLAGCGGGGELADETARRRAGQEQGPEAPGDTMADSLAAYRVPAFLGGRPSAETDDAADTSGSAAGRAWQQGVLVRGAGGNGTAVVRGLRVGRNEGFDRLVIDFGESPVPAHRVEYRKGPVEACGSGEPAPVDGGAVLVVSLRDTQAHDDGGQHTVAQRDLRADMPVLRQVRITCDFEGEVALALGVTTARPYRALVQPQPNRLIIDVQQ